MINLLEPQSASKRGETYIIPDGHDEHHGDGKSLVQLIEAANLSEAVAVTKDLGHSTAQLRSEGTAVLGKSFVLGSGDLNLGAILDEELGELVLLELAHDAIAGISVSTPF
jgi:hypothetical protein